MYELFGVVFLGVTKYSIILLLLLKILQKLTIGRCRCCTCLVGKTAIVTGGSSGIGFATAVMLASRGCKVIIADRNKSHEPIDEIKRRTQNNNIKLIYLNLRSLESVREFAKEITETIDRLDILINNAGVGGELNKYTKDGLHPLMQINYFGPFLLTHLLSDLLKKSSPSRIIFVGSLLSFFVNGFTTENLNYQENHILNTWENLRIYSNSKLCILIASNEFAKRLEKFGVTCNVAHPGLVSSNIVDLATKTNQLHLGGMIWTYFLMKPFGKSPEDGAQTSVHLALSSKVENVTGKFFLDCLQFPTLPITRDKALCTEVWTESEKLVGLKETEKLTFN